MFDWVLNTLIRLLKEKWVEKLKAIEKAPSPLQLAFGIIKNF